MADEKTTSTPAKKAEQGKKVSFFSGVKAEFKKIIWPTKDDLTKQTIAVIVVSIITGAIIALLDMALQYGLIHIVK